MKKALLLTLLAVFAAGVASVSAQEDLRKKYTNFSYSMQKLMESDNGDLVAESKWGFGYTSGRTYRLHPEPIVGMLHIGLDATWFDVNYAHGKYTAGISGGLSENSYDVKTHQLDISMGIGPSIHVTPLGKLGIHTYFRYNPTFATYFATTKLDGTTDFNDAFGGYASMYVCGGAVSWGTISVGAEARWGQGNYKNFKKNNDGDSGYSDKAKFKTTGMRVYLGLRF